MSGKPAGYKEVSERIQEFRAKHPDGCLQSEVVPSPVEGFVIVKAYAYRTPDDPRPGVGLAWEPVPGKTNFTRDSELMNAETSAWGRAIIAIGASDAKEGIASADEIRNRQAPPQRQAPPPPPELDEITQEQIDDLNSLAAKVGDEAVKKVCDWAGVPTLPDLTGGQATAVIDRWNKALAEVAV